VSDHFRRCGKTLGIGLLCVTLMVMLTGCEVDSFLDPSEVIRAERTPVEMPILSRIDLIEDGAQEDLPVTQVRPEDLVPSKREYTIGSGDLLTVSVFELIQPQTETTENRQVDQAGNIRMPVIGEIEAAGKSTSQLEEHIADILVERQIFSERPNVSVVLQRSQHNTFAVISQSTQSTGGVGVGTYNIPKPNFRLLDAIAMARGVPGRTRRLLIFRQTALADRVTGEAPTDEDGEDGDDDQPAEPDARSPSQLLEQMMDDEGGEQPQDGADDAAEDQPAAPEGLEQGLDSPQQNAGASWVYDEGKGWVRAAGEGASPAQQAEEEEQGRVDQLGELISQRIIEIPYRKLVNGDMRYNIIVRPGDVIKVPAQSAGFVYALGAINRPGAFSVPGEKDLTLKQLIASAGGLSTIAIPERVDLIRRVGGNREAVVRLNVRAIFEGTQPDIFLKPNDVLNFGTNFPATPLAVFRNGLRMTYGFGFILDRNFNTDVFGPPGDL